MKVYKVAAICIAGAAIFAAISEIYVFSIILAISIAPMLVLHGNREFAEVHKDKSAFAGFKVLCHPLVIYFFLVLTHQSWSFRL